MSIKGVAGEDRQDFTSNESKALRRRSLRLLGDLLGPHKRRITITMAMVLASTALQVVGPLFIAAGIDRGLPAAANDSDFTPLILIGLGFVLTGLGASGLLAGYTSLSIQISQDVMAELRRRVFAHTQRLSLGFHEKYTSGRIISRQTSDIAILAELLNGGISNLVSGVLLMVFTGGALIALDPGSALPVLVAVAPVIAISVWFSHASRREFRRSRTFSARLIIQFVETMRGIRAVKGFRRETDNNSSYAEKVEDYREATRRTIHIFGIYEPVLKVIGNLTVASVLALGAFRVIDGGLEIGVLLACVLYVRNIFTPVDSLAGFYNSFQSASAALEKISGVLDEEPTVAAADSPQPLPQGPGEIRFDSVSFSYDQDAVVLPHCDLTIPGGQTVALVGQTGAGKSTIAKLIARFYDPTDGAVTLDGVNLRDLDDRELRKAIVLVTQEPYLFSGTIADNIRLGKPDATDQEIRDAARALGADDFISSLPDGYQTDVNKRGGRLSSGQRQLVSFARAFLANPRVLILDEATSSLDMPSERLVQHALATLLTARTAVIIAHRLSTVAIADRALVIDKGGIIEDGPTEELIAGTGRFAELHAAWRESLVDQAAS